GSAGSERSRLGGFDRDQHDHRQLPPSFHHDGRRRKNVHPARVYEDLCAGRLHFYRSDDSAYSHSSPHRTASGYGSNGRITLARTRLRGRAAVRLRAQPRLEPALAVRPTLAHRGCGSADVSGVALETSGTPTPIELAGRFGTVDEIPTSDFCDNRRRLGLGN